MTILGRVVEVSVGPAGGRGQTLSGLRIAFERTLTSAPKADPGLVRVWGLERRTLPLLVDVSDAVCRVVAGYESGRSPSVIMEGPIVPGSLDSRGGITEWQVSDGGAALVAALVVESWPGQVRASQVLARIVARMGLALAPVRLPSDPLYGRGYVVQGDARRALTEVFGDCGCRWTIADGRVVPLPLTGPSRETAVLLTPESGLVEQPRRVDGGRVEAVSLLLPSMRVGDAFRLTADGVEGDYVATEVTHRGDSGWSLEYYTTVTGRPR